MLRETELQDEEPLAPLRSAQKCDLHRDPGRWRALGQKLSAFGSFELQKNRYYRPWRVVMNNIEAGIASGEGSTPPHVYTILRRMIVTGTLKPGEELKIDGLGQRLQTGVSPIRDVLSLQTSDNLFERTDQRGFRTAEDSEVSLPEILLRRCIATAPAFRPPSMARAQRTRAS